MDYQTYVKRLELLEEMISNEKLNSVAQITKKFNCSDRTARRLLSSLRNKGFEFEYCFSRKTFIKKS